MAQAETLKIRNWDRWQSYRKDRGQPPWIKIHRQLMRDQNWVSLTDAQRGQLVAIWMLAADRGGVIPASPAIVRKLCFMDSDPDINLFIEKEFIEWRHDDASMASDRRQHDQPEERREEKNRVEEGANAPDEYFSCEMSQPSPADSPSGLSAKRYEFEGKVIKLKKDNFSSWEKAFSNLDLRGELIARDAWLASERAADNDRKNWFVSTSKYLANRNLEAKSKTAALRERPKVDLDDPKELMRFILS